VKKTLQNTPCFPLSVQEDFAPTGPPASPLKQKFFQASAQNTWPDCGCN